MSILIHCPHCGRELKLPDRSLLGRKGKCGKCQHTFILQETSTQASESEKSVVREQEPPTPRPKEKTPPTVSEPPVFPNFAEPPILPPAVTSAPAPVPVEDAPFAAFSPPDFAALEQQADTSGAAGRLRELHSKSRRQRNRVLMALAAIAVVAAGIVLVSSRSAAPPLPSAPKSSENSPADAPPVTDRDEEEFDPTETEYALRGSPTTGRPIQLQYIPFGTQVVINLHPAELWKSASLGEELRFCVPPIAQLVESTLRDLFQRPPDQVDELLICLIPGPRGSLPDVAAVAHLTEEPQRSRLIEQLGERIEVENQSIYISGERAYMIAGPKTLVVCPKNQADEMVKAITDRHPAEQIDPLLPLTDHDRQVTLILTPVTFQLHEAWFPENVRPLIKQAIDWLGDDVESLAWSFHLTPELFYSDLVLRNKKVAGKKLERTVRSRLGRLASELVPLIQQMNPTEAGKRMVIGRLPAMVEVFSLATIFRTAPHHVQLVTPLPDRAAPNLFLGSLLAWDESTRTDFTKARPMPPEGPMIPARVADRLKMTIDVDFRATPFSEAFAYLSSEIKTPIELDGDAIKAGGFTKNIKQTFQQQGARVQDVIVKIFEESKGMDVNPEKKLVIIVDEKQQRLLVTTLAAANRRGLSPFDL